MYRIYKNKTCRSKKKTRNTILYSSTSSAKYVEKKGFGEEYQVTGLFHDLLEDTDCTEEEILKLSNENVLEAVKLLTKTKGYIMSEYIENISKNEIAKMVKLADRIHNLSEAKATSIEFQTKYIKETQDWFLELAKETIFEKDLKRVLDGLINTETC